MRLEFFRSNSSETGGSDAIFHLEKFAQACRQEGHDFLPCQDLAADAHRCILNGTHHLKPGFAQIGTALVVDHAEACTRGVSGQHIAD